MTCLNEIDMMKVRGDIVYCGVAWVACLVMLAFGLMTVPHADDWLYATIIGTNPMQPIEGFSDFVRSALSCYTEENGRLATVLTQFFCGLVKHTWVFYLVNTVMFALLLRGLRLWISGKERSVAVLTASLLFFLVVVPYPGQTMLWISGADSYMWASALSLLLLWHFVHGRSDEPRGAWALVGLFIASEMCGRLNESISIPVAFGWVMWLLVNRRKPSRAMAVSLAGYALGVLILLASPTGWERMANSQAGVMTLGQTVKAHLQVIGSQSVAYATPVLALVALAIKGMRRGLKALAQDVLLWVMLGSIILITALGMGYARVMYFYVLTGFIVVVRELYGWLGSKRRLMQVGAVVMGLACLLPAWRAWKEIKTCRDVMAQVDALMEAAPADAVLPAQRVPAHRWAAASVLDTRQSYDFSPIFCAHWHKRSILFLPDALYALWNSPDIEATAVPVAVKSSLPQVADTVLTYPGKEFSLVRVPEQCATGDFGKLLYCLNPANNRMNNSSIKSAFMGNLHDATRLGWFKMTQRGRCYLVTPPLEDDVTRMEVPVLWQGREATLVLSQRND